jgi:pimeloyl-ACP methyl ester carboxylesterase
MVGGKAGFRRCRGLNDALVAGILPQKRKNDTAPLSRPATHVVYVHGLWLSGHESLFLRRRLARESGFALHTFSYPTVSSSMAEVTERLHAFVQKIQPETLHLVGHSLGGLVIYRFLERYPQQAPGRVVFLGTPSVASRAAVSASRNRLVASLVGRCVAEELLKDQARRWQVPRDLGIIAGTQPLGLGQFFARFEEECDGTIGVSETRMPGATDHITLPVSHMGMMLSARVARETAHFLERGSFSLRTP